MQYQMPLNRKYKHSIELGQLKVLTSEESEHKSKELVLFLINRYKKSIGHMMDQSIVSLITQFQLSSSVGYVGPLVTVCNIKGPKSFWKS